MYTDVLAMSDGEVTRWQHNRTYPQPIHHFEYTEDLICNLQISIGPIDYDFKIVL